MKKNNSSIESTIFHGTIIIIIVGIIAKIASFISEAILAAYLGTTSQSDAYYMVSSIQQVIYPMLSVGVWMVFLPMYKERLAKDQIEEADSFANKVITLSTIISFVATLAIFVFSDNIVAIVAPGFSTDTKILCSKLVKISSPMYIGIMVAAVYSAMLQCHNKFLGSQIREIVTHIPVIITALLFYNRFGVSALAVALAVGGLVRLLVQLPFVDWGYRFHIDLRIKDHNLAVMFRRLPSALISEGINQFNTLIDKVMASSLAIGAVSSLNYATKLSNVFSGLLSTSIATALYPQVVELAALNKKKELSILISKIIKLFAFIMLPVTIACILFSSTLVSVVFERGAFDNNSVNMTSGVFACYCIGLFFIACNTVLSNIFYGHGDTKTPMYTSMANLIANVIGNVVFISIWGAKGLALSTSTSAMISFGFRMLLVRKYISLSMRNILGSITKILLISIVACIIPKALFTIVHVNAFLELGISAITGVLVFIGLAKAIKLPEFNELLSLIMKKGKR